MVYRIEHNEARRLHHRWVVQFTRNKANAAVKVCLTAVTVRPTFIQPSSSVTTSTYHSTLHIDLSTDSTPERREARASSDTSPTQSPPHSLTHSRQTTAAPTHPNQSELSVLAMSRSASSVLLAALILLVALRHTNSLTVSYNLTNTAPPPPLSSVFDHSTTHALHSTVPITPPSPLSSATVTHELGSSIDTVRGCASNAGSGTSGCGIGSVLTITGSGFSTPAILEVAHYVNCTVAAQAVNSSTLITTPLCPYYWPQQQLFDLRIITNNTAATLPSAISFANTAPVLARITSTTCTVPPYNGCDPAHTNYLTITGQQTAHTHTISTTNPLTVRSRSSLAHSLTHGLCALISQVATSCPPLPPPW